MRIWAVILLALAPLVPAGRLQAQIDYVPVSYDVDRGYGNPEAKYKVADGRLEVQVSSEGMAADNDTHLPYLRLRMKVENKAAGVATLSPADQLVTAEGWGDLQPEYAIRSGDRVLEPVAVQPGKSVTLDLYYGLGHIVNPAKADRFTLRWEVGLPGSSYTGETLFRQAEVVRYAEPSWRGYYGPWRPWHSWRYDPWWRDRFFLRPTGSFFFDPFFRCDPVICGRPIGVRVFDRDRFVFHDRDDLRIVDRDDLRREADVDRAHGSSSTVQGRGAVRAPAATAPVLTTPAQGGVTGPQGSPWPALKGVMPRQPERAGVGAMPRGPSAFRSGHDFMGMRAERPTRMRAG